MKKILWLCILIFTLITGCSEQKEYDNEINQLKKEVKNLEIVIEEKNKKIEKLEKEIEDKNNSLEEIKKIDSIFPVLSNISLEFVRGHTKGDINKLKKVVSDDITIFEKDNKIYGKYTESGQKIEYLLYDNSKEAIFQDMIIQGYGYYEEDDSYVIHIREFYNDNENKPISPPTFLNLYFRESEEGWKIVRFEFDV